MHDYSEVTSTAHRDIDKACQLAREKKYHMADEAFMELAKQMVSAAIDCRDKHMEAEQEARGNIGRELLKGLS
jgi:5'-deoxynucleotidase YfbR-like HD superfamily hydrolase